MRGQMRMALPFSRENAIETPANPARSPWSLATYRREIPRKPGETRLISKHVPIQSDRSRRQTYVQSFLLSLISRSK
jgi:hypothetical protein